MIKLWPLAASVCLGILSLFIASVVILSLIPLYVPPDFVYPYADKRPFVYEFTGNITKTARSIDSSTIDTASLPTIQKAIRNFLREKNLLRFIIPNVEQAFMNQTEGKLRAAGYHLLEPLCNKKCYDLIWSSLNESNTTLGQFNFNVGGVVYTMVVQTIKPMFSQADFIKDFGFTYEIESYNGSLSGRSRRQITSSLDSLIQRTLTLCPVFNNIPYTILNQSLSLINETGQLIVMIRSQFPINCFTTCRNQATEDYYYNVLNYNPNYNFTYKTSSSSYKVLNIYPSPSSSAPPNLQILNFNLNNSNLININRGPIDQNSLTNLRNAFNNSINSSTPFGIIKASFETVSTTSRSLERRQTRQTPTLQYILVVIIKFQFDSSKCNYSCQESTLIPIINGIRNSVVFPPITINGIVFNLPSPTIGTFQKPVQYLTTTVKTTTTSTSTQPSTAELEG